jgi:hypothetical protein
MCCHTATTPGGPVQFWPDILFSAAWKFPPALVFEMFCSLFWYLHHKWSFPTHPTNRALSELSYLL